MKIDKNSWHAKLVLEFFRNTDSGDFLRGYRSQVSLCQYFWTVVFSIVAFIAVLTVIGFIGITGLWVLLSVLCFFTIPLHGGDLFGLLNPEFGLVLSFIFCVVGTTLGVGFTVFSDMKFSPEWINQPLRKLFPKRIKAKPVEPEKFSLVKETYKAYKSKFCPMLTLDKGDK